MAKYYGTIGFGVFQETVPSVYTPSIVERKYAGDLVKNYRRLDTGEGVNDDLNISNEISIVADPYAIDHFHSIRYASFHGSLWKVTSVEVSFPRLILSIGGVYNGPTPTP